MNDYSYVETAVKKKETAGTYALRVGMILAAIIAFFASFYNLVTLVISIIVIIAVVYFFPQLKIEYEYIFVDGQLDFDVIYGGNKRKHNLRIEFEQVEIMAPKGSHALDQYENGQYDLKVKNYTSRDKERENQIYVIIYKKGNTAYKILFEPTEKMVKAIKQHIPRKLITD